MEKKSKFLTKAEDRDNVFEIVFFFVLMMVGDNPAFYI